MTRAGATHLPSSARRIRWLVLALSVAQLAVTPAAPRAQISSLRAGTSAPDLVLERDDWQELQPTSMEDLLRQQVGIVIARRGGLGSPEFVNVAGSVVGAVRVVVDGLEYNEPELQWPRLFAIQVSSVERIELHRTTDPARLEIWTREAREDAPLTEIDVGRGDLTTRTQRVQLLTPKRSVRVGVRYEELRRGSTDFRRQRPTEAPEFFGSYDGRAVAVEAELVRPNGESLLLRHEDFNDNAHGSFESRTDVTRALRTLNGLRWRRRLGSLGMWFDASHLVWDRDRVIGGVEQQVSESRGRLALDLELPAAGAWRSDLRARATESQGERIEDDVLVRGTHRRYDLEMQTSRAGALIWSAWAGAHRHEAFGNSWSARGRVGWQRESSHAFVQMGRGVSFAGLAESDEPRAERVHPGTYVATGVARRAERVRVELSGYLKHLEGTRRGAQTFFSDLTGGPSDVAGTLGSLTLQNATLNYEYDLGLGVAWTPYVEGDAGGLPKLQLQATAGISRKQWFRGDLVISLHTIWRLETRRRFTDDVALPGFASCDAILNARVFQRVLVFWNVTNALDTLYESYPGVLMPGRRSYVGLRVNILN